MIQWYPGHMAKAIAEMEEKIKLVDLVIVLLDARIPNSSCNPALEEMFKNRLVFYVMTKKDMADNHQTNLWLNYYQKQNKKAFAINAKDVNSIKKMQAYIINNIMAEKRAKDAKKGLKERPIKAMIVGIPNVGKSTLINALVNKKATMVGNKPGITKSQQWIRINPNFELLDTPGVLWSKFEDEKVALNLALTGAIKDNILPSIDVAIKGIEFLQLHYSNNLNERYKIDIDTSAEEVLQIIARNNMFYNDDKSLDLSKAALLFINDLRNNRFGKITFDLIEVKYE